MLLSEKQRLKIKEHLPVGWNLKIARKHRVSSPTVSRVMNGLLNRPEILEDIISLAEENKERIEAEMAGFKQRVANL